MHGPLFKAVLRFPKLLMKIESLMDLTQANRSGAERAAAKQSLRWKPVPPPGSKEASKPYGPGAYLAELHGECLGLPVPVLGNSKKGMVYAVKGKTIELKGYSWISWFGILGSWLRMKSVARGEGSAGSLSLAIT